MALWVGSGLHLLLAGDVLGPDATAPYIDYVLQANRGADLDFLFGASGHEPPSHNH
jgi:hypothetical protein